MKGKAFVVAITFLAFFVGLFSTAYTPAQAADFYTSSDYLVQYSLADDKVHVVYQITEENLSDSHRILSRSINYPAEITNTSAQANGSPLKVTPIYDGTYTKITVNFNRLLFSKGATLSWSLEFDIPGGVVRSGTLRYFYLTGFQSDEQTDSFRVYVDAPNEFGASNFVSDDHYETRSLGSSRRFTFNAGSGSLTPVTLIFGDFQIFNFDYGYTVDPSATVEFVVPSDRYNQQVFFSNVDPMPSTSKKDSDGNYIVTYSPAALNGSTKISFAGSAIVYPSSFTGGVMDEPNDFAPYLKADEYWESGNSNISIKADQLTSSLSTNREKAKAVYQYVADTLVYASDVDLSTRERKGAAVAMLSPNESVCQEYSDLFIALARAAGVPAREVAGFAEDVRSEDEDILTLHSWVEYWDDDTGWTMADPTWASSSDGYYFGNLGSDHFSMLVRGVDSIDPAIIASFDGSSGGDSLDITSSATAPTPVFSGTVTARQFGNMPMLQFSVENTGNVVLTINNVGAQMDPNGETFTSDADESLIALPGTTTKGYLSFFSLDFPLNLASNVHVTATITNSFYLDSTAETIASISNAWFYVGAVAGLFGILALALLIVLTVKCKRNAKRRS